MGRANVDRFQFGTLLGAGSLSVFSNCPEFPSQPTGWPAAFMITINPEFGDDPGSPQGAIMTDLVGGGTLIAGDAGGPMIAELFGVRTIIGVHSLGNGWRGVHSPTFLLQSANFIRSHLGLAELPPESDPDGDDVVSDNCPHDANTDQLDRDEDGVGDVCDRCAPVWPLDTFDGTLTLGLADPDQADCSDEASSQVVVALGPRYEEAGDTARISMNEYLRSSPWDGSLGGTADPQSPEDCDSSLLLTRRAFKGDTCDPVPCAATEIETERLEDGPLTPADCPVGTLQDHFCEWEIPTAFVLDPVVRAQEAGTQGEIGLRHCRCQEPHMTEAERRLNCGVGQASDCEVHGSRYVDAPGTDLFWKRLSLDGQPPSADVATTAAFGSGEQVSVAWDFVTDLELLSGQPVPTPVEVGPDGTLGPVYDGIGWSFVREFGGVSTFFQVDQEDLLDDDPTTGGQRLLSQHASHYLPVDFRLTKRGCDCEEIPETAPPFPWEYCAECQLGRDFHWLQVINPADVFAFAPSRTLEASRGLDSTAIALLGLGFQRVLAAEPNYRMVQHQVARRELLMGPGTLAVTGRLGVEGDLVQGSRLIGTERSPAGLEGADQVFQAALADGGIAEGCGTLLTYSAIRDELFALVSEPGQGSTLGVWRGSDQQWHDLPLSFPVEPGHGSDGSHGDAQGKSKAKKRKTVLCHSPPGQPDSRNTLAVGSQGAVAAHLAHGDSPGPCRVTLGEPLALTFKLEDDALYVLDRLPGSEHVRLVRIWLLTGVVTVVEPELLSGSYEHLAIGVGHENDLLVAAVQGEPSVTRFAHIAVRDDEVTVKSRFESGEPGEMWAGGEVRENARGAHYLVPGTIGFLPHRVPLTAFSPALGVKTGTIWP